MQSAKSPSKQRRKPDAATRTEFEAKGLRPLTCVARGKPVTMQYFEAPPEVFEDREAMRSWVHEAYAAAVKAVRLKNGARRVGSDHGCG